MRNFVLAIAAALTVFSSAAMAGEVTGEARFGNSRNDGPDSTEYALQYNDTVANALNLGVELEANQLSNEGDLATAFTGKVGPALPTVYGFKPVVYVEAGRVLTEGDNFNVWGAGVEVSRRVYGPVSASVGYRYRLGASSDQLRENRYNVGLAADVTKEVGVGLGYYYTTGTTETEAVGVSLTRSF